MSYNILSIWFGLVGFAIGTSLGSFVYLVAERSLSKRSFWGRSYCQHCKKILHWYDLLPVFSYINLGGKCRFCRKVISLDYLLVEVVMGLLTGYLFFQTFSNFKFIILNFQTAQSLFDLIFKTFFITVLSIVFLTDIKKMFIPDRVVIPAIRLSIIFIIFITIIKIGYLYYYLFQTPIGQKLLPPHSDFFQRHALMAAEPLLLGILMGTVIALFFMALIIITKGKGMGGGDVKLGAFLGVFLGFPKGILAVSLAFFTGAAVALVLIFLKKKKFGENLPFGPFLVAGSLIALFWGQNLIDWYLKLSP